MKTIRMKMHLGEDFDIEFTDQDMEYFITFLQNKFPEVEYEIIEKTRGN